MTQKPMHEPTPPSDPAALIDWLEEGLHPVQATTEWPIGARVRLPGGEGVGTVIARDHSRVPVQVREDYDGRAVWWTDAELEAADAE